MQSTPDPLKPVGPNAVDPGDDGGAGWCAFCPCDGSCATSTPTITSTFQPSSTPTQVDHYYYVVSQSPSVSGSGVGSSSSRYQHYGPLAITNKCGSGDQWWGALITYEIQYSVDWHFFDMSTGLITSQSTNSGYNSKRYYMRFNGDGKSSSDHASLAGFTYDITSNGWGVNGTNGFPLSHDVGIEDGTNNNSYWYRITYSGSVCKGRNQPVPTPSITNTPYPTITPTPNSGYCGSVAPKGGEIPGFGDGENFQIPGFEIGDTTCVNIGGWTLNLGFLVSILNSVNITIPETFGLPGIEICFIPITVTPIVLFGIEIDLGIVLMVSAAVFVIRKLTRG